MADKKPIPDEAASDNELFDITRMLKQLAKGTCVGIRCKDCSAKPYPGGGFIKCMGMQLDATSLNLPNRVRAFARRELAKLKKPKEVIEKELLRWAHRNDYLITSQLRSAWRAAWRAGKRSK